MQSELEHASVSKSINESDHDRFLDLHVEIASLLLNANILTEEVGAIYGRAAKMLDCELFFNYELVDDSEGRTIRLINSAGLSDELKRIFGKLDVGEALCGLVAQTEKPLIINDVQGSDLPNAQASKGLGLTAFCGQPMFADGQLVGTLAFSRLHEAPFTDPEIKFIGHLALLSSGALWRARAHERALKMEQKYAELMDSSQQARFITDPELNLLEMSQIGLDTLGLTLEEFQAWKWFDLLHPADSKAIPALLAKQKGIHKAFDFEYRLKTVDGTYRWYQSTLNPVFDSKKKLTHFLGTTADIHEMKMLLEHLEDEVQARTEELRVANADLEGFTYSVAHDMRGHLRSIISTTRILEEDFDEALPTEAKDLLRRQIVAAKSLNDLMDDLLKFARISREPINKQVIDLTQIAEDCWNSLLVMHPNTLCTFQCAPDLISNGDPLLIRIVLENLLDNALKYSPNGGEIELKAVANEGHPTFAVSDAGIGFDMQYLERVFKPFERLVNRSEFPGSGIGLTNVQRIVARHGGNVWVESQPGKGSTFYFTLGES